MNDIDDLKASILSRQHMGDHLQATDMALRAAEVHPNVHEFHFMAVLNLARSGATRGAEKLYRRFALAEVDDPDFVAQRARILKDLALAAPADAQPAKLIEAADAYTEAHTRGGGHYPAVNAATLYKVAGQDDLAETWGRQAIHDCMDESSDWADISQDALDDDAKRARYYNHVSCAEAHLTLGNIGDVFAALTNAARLDFAHNHSDRAGTRRQLRLLCDALDLNPSILDPLHVPGVRHYSGHMLLPERLDASGGFTEVGVTDAIDAYFQDHGSAGIGSIYGSLACGADILFAEAALKRGIELNVVLPFGTEDFVRESVAPGGEDWIPRFHQCLADANQVSVACEEAMGDEDFLFGYAARLAMGQALQRARHLDTDVRQVVVWDGNDVGGIAGTGADVSVWRAAGCETDTLAVSRRPTIASGGPGEASTPDGETGHPPLNRTLKAMLFADLSGFSQMAEGALPAFCNTVLPALANVLDRYTDSVLARNTWGDAIFAVFSNARDAAGCAVDLVEHLDGINLSWGSEDQVLGLRCAVHFGPVMEAQDPVSSLRNYYGHHVTRAARMEPITPIGEVYVTEAMAAELALAGATEFRTEFVGRVKVAKDFGEYRMFSLRRQKGVPKNETWCRLDT